VWICLAVSRRDLGVEIGDERENGGRKEGVAEYLYYYI